MHGFPNRMFGLISIYDSKFIFKRLTDTNIRKVYDSYNLLFFNTLAKILGYITFFNYLTFKSKYKAPFYILLSFRTIRRVRNKVGLYSKISIIQKLINIRSTAEHMVFIYDTSLIAPLNNTYNK